MKRRMGCLLAVLLLVGLMSIAQASVDGLPEKGNLVVFPGSYVNAESQGAVSLFMPDDYLQTDAFKTLNILFAFRNDAVSVLFKYEEQSLDAFHKTQIANGYEAERLNLQGVEAGIYMDPTLLVGRCALQIDDGILLQPTFMGNDGVDRETLQREMMRLLDSVRIPQDTFAQDFSDFDSWYRVQDTDADYLLHFPESMNTSKKARVDTQFALENAYVTVCVNTFDMSMEDFAQSRGLSEANCMVTDTENNGISFRIYNVQGTFEVGQPFCYQVIPQGSNHAYVLSYAPNWLIDNDIMWTYTNAIASSVFRLSAVQAGLDVAISAEDQGSDAPGSQTSEGHAAAQDTQDVEPIAEEDTDYAWDTENALIGLRWVIPAEGDTLSFFLPSSFRHSDVEGWEYTNDHVTIDLNEYNWDLNQYYEDLISLGFEYEGEGTVNDVPYRRFLDRDRGLVTMAFAYTDAPYILELQFYCAGSQHEAYWQSYIDWISGTVRRPEDAFASDFAGDDWNTVGYSAENLALVFPKSFTRILSGEANMISMENEYLTVYVNESSGTYDSFAAEKGLTTANCSIDDYDVNGLPFRIYEVLEDGEPWKVVCYQAFQIDNATLVTLTYEVNAIYDEDILWTYINNIASRVYPLNRESSDAHAGLPTEEPTPVITQVPVTPSPVPETPTPSPILSAITVDRLGFMRGKKVDQGWYEVEYYGSIVQSLEAFEDGEFFTLAIDFANVSPETVQFVYEIYMDDTRIRYDIATVNGMDIGGYGNINDSISQFYGTHTYRVVVEGSEVMRKTMTVTEGLQPKAKVTATPVPTPTAAPTPTPVPRGWKRFGDDYKFGLSTGSYAKSMWLEIGDYWYYFGSDEYMAHDCWIDGRYLTSGGEMATSTYVDGMYVGFDGYIVTPTSGTWKKDNKGWWFQRSDGSYPVETWELIRYNGEDEWFYFDLNGYMLHDRWFGGYYLTKTGAMARSQWIGGYFVGSSGKIFMVAGGTWKKDNQGWWYQRKDGTYPKNTSEWIDGDNDNTAELYYFDSNGYLLTEQYRDQYYLNSNGAAERDGVVVTHKVISR